MIRLGDGFQDWNPLKERNSRDMRIIIVRPELGEVMQMSVTTISLFRDTAGQEARRSGENLVYMP